MMNNLKNNLKNYFSSMPKALFVTTLISICLLVIIFGMKKTIVVTVDGKTSKIVTYRRVLKSALETNDITVGPKDKIEPSLDSKVVDNLIVNIRKAVNVAILVDGRKLSVQSSQRTIGDLLKSEKIIVKDTDSISPSKETILTEGLEVAVTRIDTKVEKETKPLTFTQVTKTDSDLTKGKTKIVSEGKNGVKEVTTRVVYRDGKVVSKKIIGQKIVQAPVNKVVVVGTKSNNGRLVASRGGSYGRLGKQMVMTATAYGGAPERTASGTNCKRNKDGISTVAVDPRVIPLGTLLYVEGYGYARAEDTGGAIKGHKIDVYLTDKSAITNWGVRKVNVYIVN